MPFIKWKKGSTPVQVEVPDNVKNRSCKGSLHMRPGLKFLTAGELAHLTSLKHFSSQYDVVPEPAPRKARPKAKVKPKAEPNPPPEPLKPEPEEQGSSRRKSKDR